MTEVKISTQLRKLRNMLNLTQDEFGQRIGVTQANISLIERGDQDVSAKTLTKIKEAYPGINFNWLCSNIGEPFDDAQHSIADPLKRNLTKIGDDDILNYRKTIEELNIKLKKVEASNELLENVIRTLTSNHNNHTQN